MEGKEEKYTVEEIHKREEWEESRVEFPDKRSLDWGADEIGLSMLGFDGLHPARSQLSIFRCYDNIFFTGHVCIDVQKKVRVLE
tara:strand:+ start:141 stop:392 length:252 start_codon:yes stop_codon:yes gene_type:complete